MRALTRILVPVLVASGMLVASTPMTVTAKSPNCVLRGEATFSDGTHIAGMILDRNGSASGRLNHDLYDFMLSFDASALSCEVSGRSVTVAAIGQVEGPKDQGAMSLFVFLPEFDRSSDRAGDGTYRFEFTDRATGQTLVREWPIKIDVAVSKIGINVDIVFDGEVVATEPVGQSAGQA
jgi:hypothetical protein